MMGTIPTHHLAQHMRIARVRLRPRDTVSFPVAGHLQRVDREHHIPSRQQRLHPRAPVGLDPDQHLARLIFRAEVIAYQGMQAFQALNAPPAAGGGPGPDHRRRGSSRRGGPQPNRHQRTAPHLPKPKPTPGREHRGDEQRPNGSVLTAAAANRITKASGTRGAVLARHMGNRRLADALYQQAFAALTASPGARNYHDRQRARGATPPPGPPRPGKPPRRHPARLPTPRRPLRRNHRLGFPEQDQPTRRLTPTNRGMPRREPWPSGRRTPLA
jgi:hypothetical protein